MHELTASSTPEQLRAGLLAAAKSREQQRSMQRVSRILEPLPHAAHLQFWLQPRDSLRGFTPLQALDAGQLHRLEEAAEAFANA